MSRVPGTLKRQPRTAGGTIAVLSGARTVWPSFAKAISYCFKPDGTNLLWYESVDIVGVCNRACREFVGDWLWLMGDDHVFAPDMLERLISHDVDVVVPHCLKRVPPFDPVVFGGQTSSGDYFTADLPEHGLVEVWAAGSGGMLVRRHVIESIDDPWFETGIGLSEDLEFCRKVREAGFSIWCDVDAKLGHLHYHTVWPALRDGVWQIELDIGNGVRMPVKRIVEGVPVAPGAA